MQRKKSILFIHTLLCIILLSFTRHIVSAEEVTPTQAPTVNDVYDYENEGHTLAYRLLNLPSETVPGTAEVAGIKSIPDQITQISIPATVTFSGVTYNVIQIGSQAFYKNDTITSVLIPESVTSIGDQAFMDCSSLTDVTMGDSITSISKSAFDGCTNLTNIRLSESLTVIGADTFRDCINLETIDFPDDLTTIGNNAFYNCIKLKNITLPPNIVSAIGYSFQGTDIIFQVPMNSITAAYFKKEQSYLNYNYITVSPEDQVPLVKIALQPASGVPYNNVLLLHPGKSDVFNVLYYPGNAAKRNAAWSSSNTSVAKVAADGTVTAVSSGTAIITATVGTKAAKYTVLVSYDRPKNAKAATTAYNCIKITWDYVRNADSYSIYRAATADGKYKKIAEDVKTLSYVDTGLSDATAYYYKVMATGNIVSSYLSGGRTYCMSYFSKIVSAKTKIGAPEMVLASYVSDQSIKLSWGGSAGATGFLVYRATSPSGTYQYVKKVSTFTYTDTSLTKRKTYYYKIYAYDYVNKVKILSNSSKVVSAATTLPKFVTFGTLENTLYKIMGKPSSQYYSQYTGTYELYYKKSWTSFPVETAAIYLKRVCGELMVIGWSNLYTGIKVSDGNETNTGTFTLGSTMEEVNKAMPTPKYFEIYYGGTNYYYGATITTNYIKYSDGSTITFDSEQKVIGWENKGCLKVKYGYDKPTVSQLSIGTPLSEVLKALGTPSSLSTYGYPAGFPNVIYYGETSLTFDRNQELAGWYNKGKINISIGNKASTTYKVKVGSSYDTVIKAKGTPDGYVVQADRPSILLYMIYGNSIINFDSNRKVTSIQSK